MKQEPDIRDSRSVGGCLAMPGSPLHGQCAQMGVVLAVVAATCVLSHLALDALVARFGQALPLLQHPLAGAAWNALAVIAAILPLRRLAQRGSSEIGKALASTQDGFCLVADDGRIIEVNDAYCEISRFGREELVGSMFALLAIEEAAGTWERHAAQAREKGWARALIRHRHRAGYSIDAELTTRFDPRARRFAVLLRDVSEVQRRTRALAEANARFQLVLDSTAQGIFGIDDAGYCTFANQSALRLLGYEHETDLLGRTMFDTVVSDDSALEHRQPCQVRRDRANAVFVRQDGGRFPVEYWSHPMHAAGRFTGAVLTFFDVTEAQKSREALKIAATAFEVNEGIMITDTNGIVVRVNKAFTKITGFGSQDVIGRHVSIRYSDAHDATFHRRMWETALRDGHWEGELWSRRRDGEDYPERLTITVVSDDDAVASHFVVVITDITERRRADEAIHRLAYYDSLTQLPNRRLLLDRLQNGGRAPEGEPGPGMRALLFVDIDHFKTLNDSRDHHVGDLFLMEVAQRLQSCARQSDSVARLGGDEFVILLEKLSDDPAVAAREASVVAERTQYRIGLPFQLEGGNHHASASIGVYVFDDRSMTPGEILKCADIAMYQARALARAGSRSTIR
ncbi:MAG: PAS domain S-box protein [Burkholderiaceae bacterium]